MVVSRLQITSASVRLVNTETKKLVAEWRHSARKNISVASCNGHQVVCAVGSEVFYLEINQGELKEVRYSPEVPLCQSCQDSELDLFGMVLDHFGTRCFLQPNGDGARSGLC